MADLRLEVFIPLASDSGNQLLHQLEPAVRPFAADPTGLLDGATNEASSALSSAAVDQGSNLPFQHLIDQAVAGELTTGRQITMATGIEMAEEDIERLAGAADRAEASGGKRAAVFMGQELYLLDVAERRITESVSLQSGETESQDATSGRVGLDNPAWRFLPSEVLDDEDASSLPDNTEQARPTVKAADSLTARLTRHQGAALTVMGGDQITDGERIITGIDTAIILNRGADERDRNGNSSPQMLRHLQGAALSSSAAVLRVSS